MVVIGRSAPGLPSQTLQGHQNDTIHCHFNVPCDHLSTKMKAEVTKMTNYVFPLEIPDISNHTIRNGLKDIWNAYMAEGAEFGYLDIPFCPTTATEIPKGIITWEEAKAIHRKELARGNASYHEEVFVCFYIDDCKFDGPKGIWHNCEFALSVFRHFAGVITPDFSTYQDFPEAIKIYATYRMRLIGYWLGRNGIAVINNVRWGTEESWRYCFTGIPKNSIIAIGTVGGSPRKILDRERFESGLSKMIEVLAPHTIIIYGSANYECFTRLNLQGIRIVSFQSKTAAAFERRKHDE